MVFATNAETYEADLMVAKIPLKYKKRWSIETGYRSAKQIRPFTCSRNPSVRLMLFYFSKMLYNVWIVSNWIESESRTECGDRYVRPPITVRCMMEAFRGACAVMIISCMVSVQFFAEVVKQHSRNDMITLLYGT